MAQVPQVPGDVNQEELINHLNNVIREINNRDTVQVYKDETGTRRVILDKDGLRTSASGVDAHSATNDQLTFNSNNNVFKIIDSGTEVVAGVAGSTVVGSVDISGLNLSNPPLLVVAVRNPLSGTAYFPTPYILNPSSTTNFVSTLAWVDSDTVYLQVDIGSGATGYTGDWSFKYYILQETAN